MFDYNNCMVAFLYESQKNYKLKKDILVLTLDKDKLSKEDLCMDRELKIFLFTLTLK